MIIRLVPIDMVRMLPGSAVDVVIRGRLGISAESEQRAEAVERVEAPIEPERKLVEVGLQVLVADAVVHPSEPRLEVAEHQVDERQVLLGDLTATVLRRRDVVVAPFLQRAVTAPAVRDDDARLNGRLNKFGQRLGRAIWNHTQAQPTGVQTATLDRLGFTRHAAASLDGTDDQDLLMDAASLAMRLTSHPRLVNLNVLAVFANTCPLGIHHAGPELMHDAKGRLIAGQAELALKLPRRDSGRQARHQVRTPEPYRQRCMRPLHDGANGQAGVSLATTATQHAGPVGETVGLTRCLALWAGEHLWPAQALQVGRAC